jgi:hypothetical protein
MDPRITTPLPLLPLASALLHTNSHCNADLGPHTAKNGWYVGPSFDHYCCYRVWIWDTKRELICDTLKWFPTKVTMPLALSMDLVMAGVQDIVHALQNPSANSPLAPPLPTAKSPFSIR